MNALEHLREVDLAYRLGWTLVHSLWLGAAVAALLSVALAMLRRRSPQARYLAACVAMILLAVAPLATYPLVSAPAHEAPIAAKVATSEVATLPPATMPDVPAAIRPPEVSVPAAAPPAAPVGRGSEGFATAVVRVSHALEPALPWMTLAWLCGVLALSLWRLAGWMGAQRLRRLAVPPKNPALAERLKALARALRVSRPVRLLESALVRVPVVIGWLRPVILLPAGLVTGLSADQIEAVLAHELAHIRRLDYLVNLLQAAAETALFYHPAVWWVSRRIRAERENCCDDMAVGVLGNPVGYVEALAAVATIGPRPSRAAAVALGTPGRDLVGRVRRLLGLPDPTCSSVTASAAAILLVLAMLAISIAVGVSSGGTGVVPAAPGATGGLPASAAPAAAVTEKEGADFAKALQAALPAGAKITASRAGVPVEGWTSDSGPGYLVEGTIAAGKTFRIWLVARDWIGFEQLKDQRQHGDGQFCNEKCKSIVQASDLAVLQGVIAAVRSTDMRGEPSLVNGGWAEAMDIFKGRIDSADRVALALVGKNCKTDAERDAAAMSLVVQGVPARSVFAERALKGKGLAQQWCIGALGYFGDKEAAQVLIQVLADPATSITNQNYAAQALEQIADPATGPAMMAALDRSADVGVRLRIGSALARIRYAEAAPKILDLMNATKEMTTEAECARQLARLGYTKAAPDVEKLSKVKAFTAEWALDRGDVKYLDGLIEMSCLQLTGPWGKPADGVRLLLLAPAKAVAGKPVKAALLLENAGNKNRSILPLLDGKLFVNDVAHSIAPGAWDGIDTLSAGAVWTWPVDLSTMIAGPGSYKVRYEVGGAASNTITVEVAAAEKPPAPPLAAQVDELIAQLGAKDATQRDEAEKKLLALASAADIDELLVTSANSPDPETKARIARILQAPQWGEADQGLRVALRPEKREWKAGETPRLLADISNTGDLSFSFLMTEQLLMRELQVDGQWYKWSGPVLDPPVPARLAPKGVFSGIPVTIDSSWYPKSGGKQIVLTPGRHIVRVAEPSQSVPGGKVKARPVSRAVVIEILPASAEAKPATPKP